MPPEKRDLSSRLPDPPVGGRYLNGSGEKAAQCEICQHGVEFGAVCMNCLYARAKDNSVVRRWLAARE